MNFSIPSITSETLLFQEHELGNAGSDRPISGGDCRNSVVDLPRASDSSANQRRPSSRSPCSHRAMGDVAAAVHDNAETAAIYLRGLDSFSDLDPVSKLRFSAFFHRLPNVFEGMYFSHCTGMLADSPWAAVERTLGDMIAYPGLQQWWETRRHWHTEEFSRALDAIIARGEKPKAYSTYDRNKVRNQHGK